jgi:soluble lytic murein transglycosylase-like protein
MGALGFSVLAAQVGALPISQAATKQPSQTARQTTRASAHAPWVENLVLVSHSTTRANTPSGASGSVPAMIRQTFGAYSARALAVARCESGYNPSARNRSSGAMGVFQFMPSTWRSTSYAGYSPYNAWANIQAAHQVFVRDGYSWREWSC